MPSRKIEEQLESLNRLRRAGHADGNAELAIRKALGDRVNIVAARAAELAAELQLQVLIPELLKAFDRFFQKPVETDPKCWAKEAISKALIDLNFSECEPFLRGLRHIQMEPIWGRQVDTAATLRSICVLGLLQCTDLTQAEKLKAQTGALTDAEAPVRADAARALAEMEGLEPALLLRLKARVGDAEPAVTGQVLESLLKVEGSPAVGFAKEFFEAEDEEIREQAALALGASRLPEAIALLIESWKGNRGSRTRDALLRSISASRQEDALRFLLGLIRDGVAADGVSALEALALHRESAEIRKRVAEAARQRQEDSIREAFRRSFPE